jgi:hypothetical protein
LLALHDQAVSSGRTFVTGAGFGVLATASVVLKLCEGQSAAERVRVAAMPSVEIEPGRVGLALAGSIIDGLPMGGRRYANGHLVRTRFFHDFESLRLPEGTVIKTAAAPTGDMEAARRASGAAFAVSASSMVPTGPCLRAVLPSVLPLMRFGPLRNMVKRRVAIIEMKPRPRTREHSWTHARITWASGKSREGWLCLGDAMTFTTAVLVEVASRLARDERRPGAYIPGASFGPDLAVQAGGEFIQSPEISTAITRTSAVHANSHARSAASMPIASVMGFRLRAWRFVPAFMFHAHRSLGQLRRAEGFVAGAVRRERNLAYWTMTVWRDEPSMLAYVTGGAHRQAMPKLADWGEEASTGRWDGTAWNYPIGRSR